VKTNKGDEPFLPRRISDFLVGDGGMYCDACIQKRLGLRWRQRVQLVTATLAVTAYFKRGDGKCSACHQMMRVVQAVPRRAHKPARREPLSLPPPRLEVRDWRALDRVARLSETAT
jgi:hypothetical protein